MAEIKLSHLNREYILKKTEDIEKLRAEIEDMEDILASRSRVKKIKMCIRDRAFAFSVNTSLEKFTLPPNTELVSDKAFSRCTRCV